ncbi:hypothetical protein JXB31_03590 [Candidatus Woesearchaeota archaeon]|nr:hypothetical protein [Candidatus Woesearchaeota archaeon]
MSEFNCTHLMRIVLLAGFLMLFMLGILGLAGCSSQEAEREGLVEIMRIDPLCGSDNESMERCCADQCYNLCKANNLEYSKHTVNVIHCGCWCS